MVNEPSECAVELSPAVTAKLKEPGLTAIALEPIANAVPNRPVELAIAFGPIAMAMLVGVLVQFPPLPSPQNEAQVALALGAASPVLSRAAVVNAPTAAAVVVRRELIAVPFVVGLVGSLLGALGSAGGLAVVVRGAALG
ncbi:hypothetical protein [Mycobacterium sp. M26]|uniref:hypothetical protein n=1 Tax=Mycobacterium sp. M26 TaxID=1762962 RepID=UPI000AEDFEB1|nr:hypothetical protein [Mycobacterium sp. M26]